MHENVRHADVFLHRRELSALRPDEFVAARAALVKRLKADGHKDDAALVAKLRRPSVVAWALNQVAQTAPDLVETAIDAGERLRAASEQAVAGNPGDLRAATAAERQAANAVVKAAAKHLGSRADALAPALLSTIRVAALDAEVADELRQGVLVTEHEQPGFGFGLADEAAFTPAPRASKAAKAGAAAGSTKAGAAKASGAKSGSAGRAGTAPAGGGKPGADGSRSGGTAGTAKAGGAGRAGTAKTGAAKGAAKSRAGKAGAAKSGSGGPDASSDEATNAEATLRARDTENAEREAAQRAASRAAEKERKRELAARQRTADRRTREATRLAKEADVAEAEAREARAAADRAAREADAARRALEEI